VEGSKDGTYRVDLNSTMVGLYPLGPERARNKMEDEASKAQKVLAQVKHVHPGLTARDCAFFSTQTLLV
jgi:hypothetical protein